MNERIATLWFDNNRIFIKTEENRIYSQPLELFPALMDATQSQREQYYVWDNGKSVRWEDIDEDIHISNFFESETVNYDNAVNHLLSRFPWLDMKAFAQYIGMHWTKLAKFRYGVWTPNDENMSKIKNGIKAIAKEMSAAVM